MKQHISKWLKAAWKALLAFVVANIREVIFLIGLTAMATGLALVYVPSAWIAVGCLLIWLAIPPKASAK